MKNYEHFPHAALVALDREHSKQFFAARVDTERLSFVRQLMDRGTTAAVALDKTWIALYRLLHREDLLATESLDAAALGMALAGGRPMHENTDSVVTLLRPDLVPIVADALQAVRLERLAELAENAQTGHISPTLDARTWVALADRLLQFYRQAKQSTSAVAFAAWSAETP